MSCQQASRFITNSSNNFQNNNSNNAIKGIHITRGVVQQEDPYVFTESVPTTPPILFNTQKTRTRLNDLTSTTTTLSGGKLQQQQQKLPLLETNGKLAATNIIKTQASLVATTSTTKTTPTNKNVTQSLTTTTNQLHSATNNNKKITNVCIVRPQLQQQQPQHYHHHQQHLISSALYEGDLKSISPPPLYTPPTPSLWQTPLLLETSTAAAASHAITTSSSTPSTQQQVANVAPQPPATYTTQVLPITGCVTPTVQTVCSTTTSVNPSLTTTAMAKVAPIVVHHTPVMPPQQSPPASEATFQNLNQCLPPSKFHNHTLAHHLQKVECLKSKKINQQQSEFTLCNDNVKVISSVNSDPHPQLTPPPSTSTVSLQTISCASPVKHSDSEDLNEIPVNVIFRMALVPNQQQKCEQLNEKSSNSINFFTPANNNNSTALSTTTSPPPPFSPIKTNVNKKFPIPASKAPTTTTTNQIVKQQINTSSMQQQQRNATKTALNFTQQQEQLQQHQQHAAVSNIFNLESIKKTEDEKTSISILKSNIQNLEPLAKTEEKCISIPKSKNVLTHTLNKSRKFNSLTHTNLICDLPYNWQTGCRTSKGAVAIVKISKQDTDNDNTHLATLTGIPYCLQNQWFAVYNFHKASESTEKPINRSLAREERIALYKQQLRRQAMQLLSTRSLQKIPLQVARRRLICVDRLLRKYQKNQENENDLPANIKRCCINGCDSYTLEMATHCQQHIVHNAAQHVFLPCTAKFADNTQCRVPVFDINHDLPLCIEHARKRDAYNRLLYEQRPRKISTAPIIMNDVSVTSSKVTTSAGGGGGAATAEGGMVMKTHNYQQPQQLPTANKRATLVNQQTRKRKITNVGVTGAGNTVGRPQKRIKKTVETTITTVVKTPINISYQQMPRLTSTNLKRKSSTTSLESIATSNSQHSTTSCTSQQQQQQPQHQQMQQQLYGLTSSSIKAAAISTTTSLPPPALAPLSHHGLPQHLFSFGHDNHHPHQQHININDKHSFSSSASSTTPTELKDIISQFSFVTQKHLPVETTDVNLLNTNSNSNFTSSVMGSTTSLPTADDFLTQDMLSICENSSASTDTGLGGLSDPELMLGGPEDDIPLGDTHLLEEHDLANVLNSLPEDAFKELFATVHQDESDEIERAIELADKHLKTLQQTIGSELGDFLDFSDDMLMDNSDMCNASTVSSNSMLDNSSLFMGGGGTAALATNVTTVGGGLTVSGLVQT